MSSRTISELPSGVGRVLMEAGPRTPVFVPNAEERDALHHRFVDRLAEVEFFAPEEGQSVEGLQTKAMTYGDRKQRFGQTYAEFCREMDTRFDRLVANGDASEALENEEREDVEDMVFYLPPLAEQQVKARVLSVEPAPFHFIDEEGIPVDDLEQL